MSDYVCEHCGTEFNAPQGDRDGAWAAFDTECRWHEAAHCTKEDR